MFSAFASSIQSIRDQVVTRANEVSKDVTEWKNKWTDSEVKKSLALLKSNIKTSASKTIAGGHEMLQTNKFKNWEWRGPAEVFAPWIVWNALSEDEQYDALSWAFGRILRSEPYPGYDAAVPFNKAWLIFAEKYIHTRKQKNNEEIEARDEDGDIPLDYEDGYPSPPLSSEGLNILHWVLTPTKTRPERLPLGAAGVAFLLEERLIFSGGDYKSYLTKIPGSKYDTLQEYTEGGGALDHGEIMFTPFRLPEKYVLGDKTVEDLRKASLPVAEGYTISRGAQCHRCHLSRRRERSR